MADSTGPRDIERMERSIDALMGVLQDASRLLRALAPVAQEFRAMQAAVEQWQPLLPPGTLGLEIAAPPPPPGRRTVSVAVARVDGPIDPAPIKRALAGVPGVTGLAITRVERGRLSVAVETDRPPAELPLHDALLGVFSEGVSGGWNGDGEFIAIIGPSSATDGPC
jgi:hypothetical protein